MAANPYAKFLVGREAREVVAATPNVLKNLYDRLGSEGLKKSLAAGKWSAGQIICHLADCEIAFGFRLRQAIAQDHHTVQPFDQDAWAKPYGTLPADQALETFIALRRWNVAFLNSLPSGTYSKPLTHPERGDMPFSALVETMGGHDLNHLEQLEAIVRGNAPAA